MTDDYRLKLKRGTPVLSEFRARVATLVFAVCAIGCIMTWQGLAAYGTGIPDTEGQQLGLLRFVSAGPVQIELRDPEGNIVGRELNQIDGAVFVDGDREVIIEIPHRIAGDYEIHVNVSGSANRLQLFDVSVTDGVDTIQLANRELIVNVPRDPYVIRSDHDGFAIAPVTIVGGQAGSTHLIWILVGFAGLLAGIGILVIRSRKRKR